MKTILYLCTTIITTGMPILGEDAPGDAASPAKGLTGEGLIALTLKDTDGRLQMFTILPNGIGRKQLTSEGQSGVPTWARDGRRIAFMSIRDNPAWVAVMEADGSDQKMLAEGMAPDWSPDGKFVLAGRPNQHARRARSPEFRLSRCSSGKCEICGVSRAFRFSAS